MTTIASTDAEVEVTYDFCALPLVRRLAALLDRDPETIQLGDPLPRGWHVVMFNAPTRQSELQSDGNVNLGFTLADIGLPRTMMGGRRVEFFGDIPIGARVRRNTRQVDLQMKVGRTGRFAIATVEHQLLVDGARQPALVERRDYVRREAPTLANRVTAEATSDRKPMPTPVLSSTIVPDERLLFRYSAVTDNPHRVHYDLPYAHEEGYPALVVNGTIPSLFLLEMLRRHLGREPSRLDSRNTNPMFCGRDLILNIAEDGAEWLLWAADESGEVKLEARGG